MTGRRVLATLGLIVLATAVLPPMAVYAVNRSRVRAAATEVTAAALGLGDARPQLRDVALAADVLCGAGHMPQVRRLEAQRWVTGPRAGWDRLFGGRGSPPPDPWGNCYVANLAAINGRGIVLRVLSAGPDGIIDTPFFTADESPSGDDVATSIR